MDKNRKQQKKAKRQKKHIKRNRNHQEINLQKIGMKRRKKEVRHMRVMAGLTVFFLAVTLLFQDNMSSYQMEMNYRDYGKWFLRAPIGRECLLRKCRGNLDREYALSKKEWRFRERD